MSIGSQEIPHSKQAIVEFDDTNWTTYNILNSGLPDNYILSIAIDENGTKWIGTYRGLAVYNANGIPNSVKENILIVNEVNIFPNPTSDYFKIELPINNKISFIEIINIQGKLIKSQYIIDNQNTIDVSDFSAGLYILRMYLDKGLAIKKLIKH